MIPLHRGKLIFILLFGSFFIMMKTMPHLFNKWMKILAENISIIVMFLGGAIFFISGLLFSFAIITKKETKSSYATVNLPWYKGKVLMPDWVGNIIGAVVCLSVGTYLLYLWIQWDIFSNF